MLEWHKGVTLHNSSLPVGLLSQLAGSERFKRKLGSGRGALSAMEGAQMGNEETTSSGRTAVLVLVAVVVVAIVAFAVYYATSPTGEEVKIGVMMCLSGDLGPVGPDLVEGIELAAWQVNREGGIKGGNVTLIIEDTATDPAKAVEVGTKLIDIDGVQVIVGPMITDSTLGMADKAEASKVVLISPSATNPMITDAGEWVFRTCPSDLVQGAAMAGVAEAKGYTKVATLVINNNYGVGLEEAFSDEFSGEIVHSVRFDPDKADYRTELEAIRGKNPDAIMFVAYIESGTAVLKQANELGMNIPWVAAEGIADEEMLKNAAVIPQMENMLLTMPMSPTDQPAWEEFYDLFKEKYGSEKEPGIYAEYAYDATMLAINAVKRGGNDGESIKDALPKVSEGHAGASGDKTFDENGDVSADFDVLTVTGNELVTVGSWIKGEVQLD
jgi:ABC-type branched-subunit amino acid transport system substrate-binding protein